MPPAEPPWVATVMSSPSALRAWAASAATGATVVDPLTCRAPFFPAPPSAQPARDMTARAEVTRHARRRFLLNTAGVLPSWVTVV
ncbi:hypothetical protein SHIRM173S_08080 [Streptomyces hirsutus]